MNDIKYINFNQNKEYFIVTYQHSFKIYNILPFNLIFERKFLKLKLKLVEMLNKSNIFILVVENKCFDKDKVILWDDSDKKILAEISLSTIIKKILLTKEYLIIVINTKIYIYKLEGLKLFKIIKTINNENGVCEICDKNDFIIIYPSKKKGQIIINNLKKNTKIMLKCHNSNIHNIVLNNEGNYFATCSNKGTMIRIYQTKNGKFIKEFRRGLEKNKINWLSFSKNSDIIICQSPNTIHLFYTYFKNILKKNNTIYNIFGYLTNNYFKNSFIKFQFPNIKTISTIYNSNILIVISYHGFYYEINFKNHEFVNVLKKKLI